MAWIAPTADDVLSEFTPSELASITQLMGGEPLDNTTKVAVILARTVSEIRGYINAGNYPLDADTTTIPPGLVSDAVAIGRWRFLISAPQLKALQTDDRKALYDDSIKKLQLIAQGKFSVEDPVAENEPGAANWNSENKLIMRTHPVPRPGVQWTPQANTYANPNAPEDTPNDS